MTEQDKSTKPQAPTCRVFISYSHDSTAHQQRVLALADRLRGDGIEAWIDQYEQDPEEGWIKWMRTQVKQADKVLLVFTKTYQERFEGEEEEGKGLGATFEGIIVTQALYERGGLNSKFRPVVFHEEDLQFIPAELRRFNRYGVDSPEHYENLIRWLHEAPRAVMPKVGDRPNLLPEPTPKLFSPESSETAAKRPADTLENPNSAEAVRTSLSSPNTNLFYSLAAAFGAFCLYVVFLYGLFLVVTSIGLVRISSGSIGGRLLGPMFFLIGAILISPLQILLWKVVINVAMSNQRYEDTGCGCAMIATGFTYIMTMVSFGVVANVIPGFATVSGSVLTIPVFAFLGIAVTLLPYVPIETYKQLRNKGRDRTQ